MPLLVFLVALLAPQGALPWSDSIEREWTVRRWALDPPAAREELAAALASARWEERHAALDALERAAPGAGLDALVALARERLADQHPNVRQRALAVAAAHALALPREEAERLVRDEFPGVRAELARALAPSFVEGHTLVEGPAQVEGSAPGDGELLALLALDGDARAAGEALVALLARGAQALPAQLAAVEELELAVHPARFLQMAEVLSRLPANPALLEALRPRLAGWPAALAVWEALAFETTGAGDARALAEGWALPLGAQAEALGSRRRAFQVRGAARLPGDALRELAVMAILVDGARDDLLPSGLARLVREHPERVPDVATELLEGALAASAGRENELLVWGEMLPTELREAQWLGLRGRVLTPPMPLLKRVLGERSEAVRAAAVGTLAASFAANGDALVGDALVSALGDPLEELRRAAFLALADSGHARYLDVLHDAWVALPDDERVETLRELSRAAPAAPFRAELVALWESGRGRVASVLELLAAFRADDEVAALFARWIDAELVYLTRHEEPPEELTEGPWREAENRAKAIVQALHRAMEEGGVETYERVLARSDGLSAEVAKTCAWALGQSDAGRARLVAWMGAEHTKRVRIEAALWVGAARGDAVVSLLLERYPHCDEELQLRILRALGTLDDPRAPAHLERVALDAGHSAAERVIALEALGSSPRGPEVVAALLRIADGTPDLDHERAALASLGERGDPSALPALRARLADPARVGYLFDELLVAWARLAPEEAAGALFGAPLAGAQEELAARFRGRRLPARDFVYRGELRAAGELARVGLLDEALERAGPWWRLDARLLRRLGERALESERADSRAAAYELFLAARAALEGEAQASDLEGLACTVRARLLTLCVARADWRGARRWSQELLHAWRTGRTGRRTWNTVLGATDSAAGRDPLAWVEATRVQAEAWVALEAGRAEEARRLAAEAERRAGRSRRAAEQQARLAAALP